MIGDEFAFTETESVSNISISDSDTSGIVPTMEPNKTVKFDDDDDDLEISSVQSASNSSLNNDNLYSSESGSNLDSSRAKRLRNRNKNCMARKRVRTRKKDRIDYAKQLMPNNLTQILDKEFPQNDQSSAAPAIPRVPNSQKQLINQSDDEGPVADNRLQGLLYPGQLNHLPVNINQLIEQQESRFLSMLSDADREYFKRQYTKKELPAAITFDDIAGHQEHLKKLHEMITLPLQYPSIYTHFGISPPRGVLFHGPPGTGII
jgi:ATP-dependent 26S proteasome regulatory subunit